MAAQSLGSKSLKEYLKRYETNNEEEKKKKKKKRQKAKADATSVLVVDEDPVWQKPVVLEEENDNESADEEKPQVDEDIEVKRMRRLELLRAKRRLKSISEDGSGWVTLSPKCSNINNSNSDLSPPRKRTARNDTPSPKRGLKPSASGEGSDLSPPWQRGRRHHTPSPEIDIDFSLARKQRAQIDTQSSEHGEKPRKEDMDFSPPRRGRARNGTPSAEHDGKPVKENLDFSPPRRGRARNDTPSPDRKPIKENLDLSPPRRGRAQNDTPSPEHYSRHVNEDVDLSPPRQRRKRHHTPSPEPEMKSERPSVACNDISPPRGGRRDSPHQANLRGSLGSDHSPPRKNRNDDLSPPRKNKKEVSVSDTKEQRKTGLISGPDIREEIVRTKKQDLLRFQDMDPSISGRGAEPVYRDKIRGERITKEEFLKSQRKVEEKPKEIKLEWGKGLAQKREAEARLQELELEKDKPFAQSRDDPELDKMLKERVRWGDPMAHLVKRKQSEPVLPNLGDSEKMKESGFIIPQDIPNHSWLKRGLDAAPNRYGIKPGRHWDGVDRSSGYEKELFKRMNEKRATEREAYLWSVSDM